MKYQVFSSFNPNEAHSSILIILSFTVPLKLRRFVPIIGLPIWSVMTSSLTMHS
ncbi:hypothetical protein Scep_001397 [Stephania cephalantha]|uniref:Uncharacterized protein n=1 Tax=Stephania cephalantha TaxID=152367 RepID=A0AAP0L833_9MAGN